MGKDCDNITAECRVNSILKKIYNHADCRAECDNSQTCSGYALDTINSFQAYCHIYGDVTAPNRDWTHNRREKTIVWSSTGTREKMRCYKKTDRNLFTKQF